MGPENNVGLGGCWITECLLRYLCIVTVPHIMVGLERMLDYRGVGLEVSLYIQTLWLDYQMRMCVGVEWWMLWSSYVRVDDLLLIVMVTDTVDDLHQECGPLRGEF